MGSTSPPQQLIGSVEAFEHPPSSQQRLSPKARRNPELRGRNNWHHPRLLRKPAQIIVAVSDQMEGNDQSIPEPGIASVVQVPTQALSKARADPALQKLEDKVKAQIRDVIGATPAKNSPGKEHSTFGEAVIHSVKDHKPFRQRNLALTGDRSEALPAIIKQFLERGRMAHSDWEWGCRHLLSPKRPKGLGDLWWVTGD